jgi:uncharacterized membrane protein
VASSIFEVSYGTVLINDIGEFNMPSVNLIVKDGGNITHLNNSTAKSNVLSLNASNLTIESG